MNSPGYFAALRGDTERGDPDEAPVRRYSPETARAVIEIHGGEKSKFPIEFAVRAPRLRRPPEGEARCPAVR